MPTDHGAVSRYALPRLSGRWQAVWRRNLKVWSRLLGPALLGNFGEPLLYLLALGYGLGSLVGEVGGMPYLVFLASGIVCGSAMNTATFEGLYSAYTRMTVQQTWAAMLATPLDVEDVVLGEVIWAGTKSLISAGAILVVAAWLGAVSDWAALGVLPVVLLVGVCFGAMALVMTAVATSYDFFLYYVTLLVTPMLLFSGVFFPLSRMPEAIQWAASALPLNHAVAVVRPLMTGQPVVGLWLHLGVLTAYGLAALYVAVVLLRRRLLR